MSASPPKPFLATAMGGIFITCATLVIVAGGFVFLLVANADHGGDSHAPEAPATGDPAAP